MSASAFAASPVPYSSPNPYPSMSITVSPTEVAPGGKVTVTIKNGPTNQPDNNIQLYEVAGTCGEYTCWSWLNDLTYMNGSTTTPPSTGIANATLTFTMPTTLGTYDFYYQPKVSGVFVASPYVVVTNAPIISKQPASQTISLGSKATFSVTASGSGSGMSYQWQRNGSNISGATSSSYSIANVNSTDSGASFDVVVTDSAGSITSSKAVLTVKEPKLTVSPSTVAPGAVVTVGVTGGLGGVGDTVQLYQVEGTCGNYTCWSWLDYDEYMNGSTSSEPSSAITSANLSFTMPTTPGTYDFYYQPQGLSGIYVASPRVTVSAAPTITTQPKSVTANLGAAASFSVAASGSSLTYQWQFNGSNISGATSASYSIANVNSTQAGTYDVVVKDSTGSVTSSKATLTVNEPKLTVSPSSIEAGGVVTVGVTNGLGGVGDIVAVYLVQGTCGNYTCWTWLDQYEYMNGSSSTKPSSGITSANLSFTMPATPGTYDFYYQPQGLSGIYAASSYVTVGAGPSPSPSPSATVSPSPTPSPSPTAEPVPYSSPDPYPGMTVSVSPTTVAPGGTVSVTISGGPSSPSGDNVQLYQVEGTCNDYTCWNWEGSGYIQSVTASSQTLTYTMPEVDGVFDFYFQTSSSGVFVASPYVTVSGPVPSPSPSPSPTQTYSGTDNFPRLGGIFIGGPQSYDEAAFAAFASKLHMFIMGGNWEGWTSKSGEDKQQVIAAVKSASHVGTRIFQYVNFNEEPPSASEAWSKTYWNEESSMNWWLYDNGSSGTKTADGFNSSWFLTDMAVDSNGNPYAGRDPSTGLGPYEWGAKFANDYFHLGKYSTGPATPNLDGFFLDNVFVGYNGSQLGDGDWLRDGQPSNSSAAVNAAVLRGEASFFKYLHNVWPGSLQIGNGGDGIGPAVMQGVDISPINQVMNGGVLEGVIGTSYGVDTWGNMAEVQTYYQNAINAMANPKLLIFGTQNLTATGTDPYSSAPYQALRYGLAACLMNNGYFSGDSAAASYQDSSANYLWFDEYDGGGLGEGYLGQPVAGSAGAVQTGPWQKGVWKREFQNGIVLWNPHKNGAQTVSLSGLGNLKHLSGSQNPSLNNGAAVTNGSVTLQDRDGLILLRY